MIEFDSLDRAVYGLLGEIRDEGQVSSPRGSLTKELMNVCFTLSDPRSRLVLNEARGWSLPLAVGEFLWHLRGSEDASIISHYAPRWADFAQDGQIVGSCYGHKIFGSAHDESSQWNAVKALLLDDPDTRRAIITLSRPDELYPESQDVSCASTLQFFIRGGRLHLTTYMRSNDAIWGLPYDCFVFTMMQELMASELELELGKYVHFAASLHVYERHFDLVERILQAGGGDPVSMPRMVPVDLDAVLSVEQWIRDGRAVPECNGMSGLSDYWCDLLSVAEIYTASKTSSTGWHGRTERIEEPAYRELLDRQLFSSERCV